MFKPGMMIGDRYEIIDIVGSGGMSVVYKAKCHKLNRFVAIKVLKPEFSDDKNFVTKFRVEAQSAAGLSHPSIVNVYDVGEDDGIYYIVMELVEGITLKEYIKMNGRIPVEKAIDFAIQIASGIEVAHEHNIIHRDIKPQNIIVARNGRVKVTDFGIARAATSNTVASNAMGSVHYISPEQARGGYCDERSDIYSLGITIYEMITGRVPYEGDNTVTVALMHIQGDIIPPREYYPDIPVGLEKIVLKCTQKKAERRYLTAAALIADLKRVQDNPNIQVIANPTPKLSEGPTRMMTDDELTAIKQGTAARNIDDDTVLDEDNSYLANKEAREVLKELEKEEYESGDEDYEDADSDAEDVDDEEDEEDSDMDPKLEKLIMIGGIVAAVIIAILVMIFISSMTGWFKFGKKDDKTTTEEQTEQIEMIDVKGMTLEAAQEALKKAGFTIDYYTIEYDTSDTLEDGIVMSQSIDKGDMVSKENKVVITVSSGEEEVEVPDVRGYTDEQACTIINEAGFDVAHSYEDSETVEKDKVINQAPAGGEKAPKNSKITIVVSNGKAVEEVVVPNLSGKTITEAESTLTSLGLVLGTVTQDNDDNMPEGKVIRQSTTANTSAKTGDVIDITVSKGKKETTTTYTASFTGSVSNIPITAGETATVTVVFNIGNASYTVFNQTVTTTSVDVAGSAQKVTDLPSNNGSLAVTVKKTLADGTSEEVSCSSSVSTTYETVVK